MKPVPLDFEKPLAELENRIAELRSAPPRPGAPSPAEEIARLEERLDTLRREIHTSLTAWQRVQISRHTQRPFMLDYLRLIFTDFVELKGDRLFGDDEAMPCGLATLGSVRCVVVGHQKGRDTKENIRRNFGCAHPEGYRKALRLMKMADKFALPVISLIDTPGAFPGVGSEARHIGEAIAVNLREMMTLRVPVIAAVIGEGGSGGALGIGVADRVLILENAYYSVISPEGCAAILWKHRSHAPAAAEALKLTATDMKELGLVDDIVPEPLGGAHRDPAQAAENLRLRLHHHLAELSAQPRETLPASRYAKFRQFGQFAQI